MDKKNLALGKTNFLVITIGMVAVIIGFILMSGSGSDEHVYDPDIFSTTRIAVAPVVCLFGFLSIIGAIVYKPKDKEND